MIRNDISVIKQLKLYQKKLETNYNQLISKVYAYKAQIKKDKDELVLKQADIRYKNQEAIKLAAHIEQQMNYFRKLKK